jgi:hypothetical protein
MLAVGSTNVLLLASYDPDTLSLIHRLRDKVIEEFQAEGVYLFLLDELEIFDSENRFAVAENLDERYTTLYVYNKNDSWQVPEDVHELDVCQKGLANSVKSFMLERYNTRSLTRLGVTQKLEHLVIIHLSSYCSGTGNLHVEENS